MCKMSNIFRGFNEVFKNPDAVGLFADSPIGLSTNTLQQEMYGINFSSYTSKLLPNTDHYGYLFFTRPQFNLTDGNMNMDPRMHSYMRNDPNDPLTAIRCYLDPRLATLHMTNNLQGKIFSHMVDDSNPFISILSNTCISLTGWPDRSIDDYETVPDVLKGSRAMVAGTDRFHGTFNLSATFADRMGSITQRLFHLYMMYMGNTKWGLMYPYPDLVFNGETDYDMRIYRLIVDSRRRTVKDIFCCGAAFPTVDTTPSIADYDTEIPVNERNKEFSINFKCSAFFQSETALIHQFNDTVGKFNTDMLLADQDDESPDQVVRGLANGSIIKLDTEDLRRQYLYASIPRINPVTMELELYARTSQ